MLADITLHGLVVALTAFTGNVLQHLTLGKGLVRVLFALGGHSHAHVAGLHAEGASESTEAGRLGVLSLSSQLGVELLAGDGLTTRKFGGNVLAVKGLEDLADVGVLHRVDVFEERNQGNQFLVVGISLPGIEDNGVLGLLADMLGIGINDDDLGQVTVEVGKILLIRLLVDVIDEGPQHKHHIP